MLGSLSLAIDTRYNFVTNFLSYVYLFIYGVKWVKDIFLVIIATVAKKENASLGNSMLNHLGHVTLISWIF